MLGKPVSISASASAFVSVSERLPWKFAQNRLRSNHVPNEQQEQEQKQSASRDGEIVVGVAAPCSHLLPSIIGADFRLSNLRLWFKVNGAIRLFGFCSIMAHRSTETEADFSFVLSTPSFFVIPLRCQLLLSYLNFQLGLRQQLISCAGPPFVALPHCCIVAL